MKKVKSSTESPKPKTVLDILTQESAAGIWNGRTATINGALITSQSQFANIAPRKFIFRKDNTYLLTYGKTGQEEGTFLVPNQTYNSAFNVFDISMSSKGGIKSVFRVNEMNEYKLSISYDASVTNNFKFEFTK
jgi:hypothetical protein